MNTIELVLWIVFNISKEQDALVLFLSKDSYETNTLYSLFYLIRKWKESPNWVCRELLKGGQNT